MPFLASSAGSYNSSQTMVPLLVAGAGACATAGLCTYIKKRAAKNDPEIPHSVSVTLPEWAKQDLVEHSKKDYTTDEEMMQLAIDLSSKNVAESTGGPFGSAIFERLPDSGICKLVSVGVNRVVPLGNSTLHGETVAIQLAQSKLKSFTMRLKDDDSQKNRKFELFTSCEPCAMCLGATLWSGASRIVCAATKADAEAIGFNEGPVFEESYEHLRQAGIDVKKMVLQKEAAEVLEDYGKNGMIYNSSGE